MGLFILLGDVVVVLKLGICVISSDSVVTGIDYISKGYVAGLLVCYNFRVSMARENLSP